MLNQQLDESLQRYQKSLIPEKKDNKVYLKNNVSIFNTLA